MPAAAAACLGEHVSSGTWKKISRRSGVKVFGMDCTAAVSMKSGLRRDRVVLTRAGTPSFKQSDQLLGRRGTPDARLGGVHRRGGMDRSPRARGTRHAG